MIPGVDIAHNVRYSSRHRGATDISPWLAKALARLYRNLSGLNLFATGAYSLTPNRSP
jgi:hypothetical protein